MSKLLLSCSMNLLERQRGFYHIIHYIGADGDSSPFPSSPPVWLADCKLLREREVLLCSTLCCLRREPSRERLKPLRLVGGRSYKKDFLYKHAPAPVDISAVLDKDKLNWHSYEFKTVEINVDISRGYICFLLPDFPPQAHVQGVSLRMEK